MHTHSFPAPPSSEEGYALPQLRPSKAISGNTHSVDYHQDQAHVNRGVPQSLPCKPAIGSTTLNPAIEALHHRPQPLVDSLLPLRALHVDPVLHGEHVGWVHPPLQPPPGDDVAYLQRVEAFEQALGIELAVRGQQLHLDAFAQHPGQELLHELFLVDVQRGLDVAQGEALYVDEEEAQVADLSVYVVVPGLEVGGVRRAVPGHSPGSSPASPGCPRRPRSCPRVFKLLL